MTRSLTSTNHTRPRRSWIPFLRRAQRVEDIHRFRPERQLKKNTLQSIQLPSISLKRYIHAIRHSEVGFVVVLALGIFTCLVFVWYFFMITDVRVRVVNDEVAQEAELSNTTPLKGANMLLHTTSQIEQEIREDNPAVKTVEVVKMWPHTLEITVLYRDPVAFYTDRARRYFILSGNGTILDYEYERPLDLGEIIHYQPLSADELVSGAQIGSTDVQFASAIAERFMRHGYRDFLIAIADRHRIEARVEGMMFIAAADSPEARQIEAIDRLIRIVQQGGERLKKADVRFEKIVVEQ